MNRKLFLSAAVVALSTCPAWILPGAVAAADTPRLTITSARTAALTATEPVVDSMVAGAAARVTACRRVRATRIDCELRITAPPSYACSARAVVRGPRAPRVVLRDLACIG